MEVRIIKDFQETLDWHFFYELGRIEGMGGYPIVLSLIPADMMKYYVYGLINGNLAKAQIYTIKER
jgi:hypothetical protein